MLSSIDEIKSLLREKRFARAWQRLHVAARDVADYPAMHSLSRLRRQLAERSAVPAQPARVRLALLSDATTTMLEEPLRLALEAIGVDATLHVAPFNTLAHEMLDPRSDTVRFEPDLAVIMVTTSSLTRWPSPTASESEVEEAVNEVCDHWLHLCKSLREHAGCDVVLSNFPTPPVRALGSAGVKLPGDATNFVRRLNQALAGRAPSFVHIHDVETLAALHGTSRWVDTRYWYHARQPISFECLVPYVRALAALIGALYGRSAKCVVVDLDNTLWGGVVGDDGPERLHLGEGDPQGEAFVAFQRYLLSLKERGIALAVASKNDEEMALAPFDTRPEMALRRHDFAVFRANWRPKSESIRDIAATLNIGLDAIVFVDDNPAEREQIRQALPEVRVVELGADPALYPMLLDRTGWLETATLSAEDRGRSRMYAANAGRAALEASADDYDGYLRSLEQRAVIAPFEARHLDRIHQLTNKTNQFNLTTRRMTASQLADMMTSSDHITAYVRLADRFGDNGLISVFAAHREGSELSIDLWLMSCRVLQRGVERALRNYVVERARHAGCARLRGIFIPTARNGLVKDHYRKLGFTRAGSVGDAEHWLLDISTAEPLETRIAIVDEYAAEPSLQTGEHKGEALHV
jgi:FkbH-like protein